MINKINKFLGKSIALAFNHIFMIKSIKSLKGVIMSRKYSHNRIIINRILVIAILGLFIGTFLDFQINSLLYWRGTIIPNFFRLTGEMPMVIILNSISIAVVIETIKRYKKIKGHSKHLYLFLATLLPLFTSYISASGIPHYFESNSLIFSMSILLVYLIGGYLLSFIYIAVDYEDLLKYFNFVVSVIALSLVIMTISKNLWSRARYFHILEKNKISEYSLWFIPQFRSVVPDVYKSFPSGHTTSAATSLLLVFVPTSKENARYLPTLKLFAVIWSFSVALGRILDGAHFLSDVSMGLFISSGLIILMYKLVYKNPSRDVRIKNKVNN